MDDLLMFGDRATLEPLRHVLSFPEYGLEMAFRLIPSGAFRMGSRGYSKHEEPIHRVRITESFWLAETPVTQAEFALFTRAEGVAHENHFKGRPDHPAESLSWREAIAYCAWLTRSKASELPEGFGLACLPTEAEWEYVCRAGTDTEYHSGDGEEALTEAGWFGPDSTGSTHPVRLKKANAFRLFDLHGNVFEWCHDAWDTAAYRKRVDGDADPGGPRRRAEWQAGLGAMTESDHDRVMRGGSWDFDAVYCRSAFRYRDEPGVRNWYYGFRVCLVRGLAEPREDGAEPREAPEDAGRGTRPEAGGAKAITGVPDLRTSKLPRRK